MTDTERLLAELCERSFLKLWSYPNPFKDDRDELCDLLAVFENHVFIFFDREGRQLNKPGVAQGVSWDRWKRKVIDAQIGTAHGAERYIRSGRGIFLDPNLRIPFPIAFNPMDAVVHKIIVAHGAKEACEAFSDENVYGSLGISYARVNDCPPFDWPFLVHIDKENPVHIFDSHNLPIILGELDTFFDFSSYLDIKAETIKGIDGNIYCGEEDLLAHYLRNFDSARNRHFIGALGKDYNFLHIGEGEWKSFLDYEPYKRKKIEDAGSYLWDEIIQHTCQNALDGTLLGNANILAGKSAVHEMAKEPRFSRRALSKAMIAAIRKFPEGVKGVVRNLSFMPSFYEGKAYVFLQLKADDFGDYEKDYRPKRRAALRIACGAAKNKFDHLHSIIGIAIDSPKYNQRNSEDFILMDCSDWPTELRAEYEKANEGFKFFETPGLVMQKLTISEFPPPDESASGESGSGAAI
ncbi:MAG: hypothetical protein ACREEI_02140 [Stellaceae bacterium]